MSNETYKEGLRQALASATPSAIAICRAWHGEHFGESGWGGVDFVTMALRRAQQAVEALTDAYKTSNDLIRKIAQQVLGREDAYGLDILDGIRALAAEVEKLREVARAADKVIADWEASCRDHPVDYAKPQTLHPFGPAIGWQSLHGLRDALAKRREEGE